MFGTTYASYDLLNPATNGNLRAGRNRRAARLAKLIENRGPLTGTEGSKPSLSSSESANFQYLSVGVIS